MAKKSKTSRSGLVASAACGVAVGTAFGTFVLSPNLPGGALQESHDAVVALEQSEQEARIAKAQASTADSYIEASSTKLVAGALKDIPVVVMTTDDADADDVASVDALLQASGASVVGRVGLTEKFFQQDSAEALKSIVANTLPAGAQLNVDNLDPGTHAGEALGAALLTDAEGKPMADEQERALLLNALQQAGFMNIEGAKEAARVAIIITGEQQHEDNSDVISPYAETNLGRLALGMNERGSGVVLAGRINTAADGGAIDVVRTAQERESGSAQGATRGVSTIDSVNMVYGQIGVILSARDQLLGKFGAYGAAESAEAAGP
ncbi:copper transporter [Corynebacterium argentoratense]|uniref:copper transporter n=1 Tax=Corynebacterium argentoratense TaxID=42817 RepID=UPI001F2C7BCD|nr:copper transporter [Corynebacterium argentoratense]MCF1764606.1 copper transporter [Corynebacterium argentoratense]